MPLGHRCGYVKLPEDHPWYGKHYDDIDVRIHGGLTFAGELACGCSELDSGFWIGFDCAHCYDMLDPDEMSPEYLKSYRRMRELGRHLSKAFCDSIGLTDPDDPPPPMPEGTIRGRVYVEGQCKQLAAECAEVAKLQKSLEAGNGEDR